MVVPPRLVALTVATLFAAGALAGCLGDRNEARTDADPVVRFVEFADAPTLAEQLARLPDVERDRFQLEVDVDIHLVFVGWTEAQIDQEALRERLPKEYQPVDRLRSLYFNNDPLVGDEDRFHQEGLTYRWNYVVRFAPDAFGEALFAHALEGSSRGPIPPGLLPGEPYLLDYDQDSRQGRLAEGEDLVFLEAERTETWIAENRAAHGLEFAKPSYTFFLLDSWTKGWFPHDETYYYWWSTEDLHQSSSIKTLRGWGGNHDFLWLDFGAAPNNDALDNGPTHRTDPPAWDYAGTDRATVNSCTEDGERVRDANAPVNPRCTTVEVELVPNLARDVASGLQMHVMPSFLYHPTYRPTYFLNIHLFHEPGTVMQDPAALERMLDLPSVLDRLQSQIPWAEFDGVFSTYRLPNDDPGFHAALQRAKAEGGGTYVPTKPIMNYLDNHAATYWTAPEGSFQVKVVYVNFEAHYAWALPVVVAGIAAANPEGKPWGVLGSQADLLVAAGLPIDYGSLTAHEVGHFWGLNHPHDGTMRDPETGAYREAVDFTWDQTSTPLSYRMVPYYSNQMDRDHMARGMTAMNVNDALKQLRIAYENERAADRTTPSAAVAREARITEASLNTAITLFQRGLWVDAVHASIAALDAANAAVEASGGPVLAVETSSWDGLLARPGASAPLVDYEVAVAAYYDYREVDVRPGDESLAVRVEWTNGVGGACDLFVGWHFIHPDGMASELSLGIVGADLPARVPLAPATGVFDLRDQGAASGPQSESFTLDLDDDGVRESGSVFVGAGSKRGGVCPYVVTVDLTYRPNANMRGEGAADAAPPVAAPAPGPVPVADAAREATRRLLG